NSMYVGMKHHFAGMTFNINKNNTIGIMANYLNIGEMEVTTIENPEGTGEMFGASSYAIGMSYGNQLTDRVYVGIQGKFIKEKIWLESATGFAVDIGTIYNIEEIGLRIGMALQNLGVDMSVDDGPHLYFYKEKPDDYQGSPQPKSRLATKSFPMPLTFSIGTSVNIVGENAIMKSSGKNRITVSVSANDGFDNAFRTNWGMEYSWREFFALRSGYRQNYDTAGLSLGFGLNTESFTNFNLQIDYAWVDYGDLGPIDLWSIEFKF
ncbi:MAG: PorV/PorQ family protein, partial [Candidatus Marinimicrobia bacterium]|nr:PorV/PorQ family protein [Candidatus Neomarinimicrobiota bacterium]